MPDPSRPVNRASFTALLAAAMAAGTFAGPVLGALARFIIDDLGISRAQLGWVATAFAITGAVASPFVGRLTDRIGGRTALAGVFAFGGMSLVAISGAPSLGWLFLAAAAAGLAQSAANPSTNKLISVHLSAGYRGATTGIKQSGVQFGVFLAGILLPIGALAWGWRTTVLAAGLVAILTVVVVHRVVPPDPRARGKSAVAMRAGSPRIVVLAVYGCLMGIAAGSVTTYLPLYGEEEVGLSVTMAGAVLGLGGLVSIAARILWARHAEKTGRYVKSLRSVAAVAVLFVAAMMVAPTVGSWALWIGALGFFATSNSWNAVGMLAVMVFAGAERSGGASGIVLFGFLSGLAIGPPLFGWSVDRFGTYTPAWSGLLAVLAMGALLASIWDGRTPRPGTPIPD